MQVRDRRAWGTRRELRRKLGAEEDGEEAARAGVGCEVWGGALGGQLQLKEMVRRSSAVSSHSG